jgi:Ca-activated chloride channel family protein
LTVAIRYKAPGGEASQPLAFPLADTADRTSPNLGFASAVAEFGMLLRGSEHRGQASFAHVAEQARRFRGADPDGDRSEFVNLVEMARGLRGLKDARW